MLGSVNTACTASKSPWPPILEDFTLHLTSFLISKKRYVHLSPHEIQESFWEKNALVASTNRRILFVQVKTSEKSLQVSNFISPLAFYTTFDEFQNCFLQSTQN